VTEAQAALKKWQYESPHFPKPCQILELVASERERQKIEQEGCSKECQKRHGLGYGENDVRWLWRKYTAARATNPIVSPEDFLDELDQKRGHPPAWRQQHEIQPVVDES